MKNHEMKTCIYCGNDANSGRYNVCQKCIPHYALLQAIEHWERMRENPYGSESPVGNECSLCNYFARSKCYGCPVSTFTREPHCKGTPWYVAVSLFELVRSDRDYFPAWQIAASKEIQFLTNLLPPTKVVEQVEKSVVEQVENLKLAMEKHKHDINTGESLPPKPTAKQITEAAKIIAKAAKKTNAETWWERFWVKCNQSTVTLEN